MRWITVTRVQNENNKTDTDGIRITSGYRRLFNTSNIGDYRHIDFDYHMGLLNNIAFPINQT